MNPKTFVSDIFKVVVPARPSNLKVQWFSLSFGFYFQIVGINQQIFLTYFYWSNINIFTWWKVENVYSRLLAFYAALKLETCALYIYKCTISTNCLVTWLFSKHRNEVQFLRNVFEENEIWINFLAVNGVYETIIVLHLYRLMCYI